jgi:hypothetical protein
MLNCVSQWPYFLFASVGIQKGHAGHCLVEGRVKLIKGQVKLIRRINHTAYFWLYRAPVLHFNVMHMVLTGTYDVVR